jgi:hypothetical protein
LYTDPKPPSPNLLLLEKLSVALAMAARSNIGNSISSFLPSLLLLIFWHLFLVPKIVRESLGLNNFKILLLKQKLTTLFDVSSHLETFLFKLLSKKSIITIHILNFHSVNHEAELTVEIGFMREQSNIGEY